MIDHAQVLAVEDVGAVRILFHRPVLPRSGFLHDGIMKAAGLDAFAPVGLTPSSGKEIGQEAAAGPGNAHCTVAEYFQLDIDLPADIGHFLHGNLSCQNDTGGAQLLPHGHGSPVCTAGLRGNMDGQIRCNLSCQGEYTQIGNQRRIGMDFLQIFQVIIQPGQVLVPGDDIHRDIDFLSHAVGIFHGFLQFLPGEIAAVRSEAEALSRKVYRIGSVKQSHLHFFHRSRRSEKFYFIHDIPFCAEALPRRLPFPSFI